MGYVLNHKATCVVASPWTNNHGLTPINKNNWGQTPINPQTLLIQELLAYISIGLEEKMIGKNRQKTAFYNR